MESSLEPCAVGCATSEDCHLTLHTSGRYGFIDVKDMGSNCCQLIELRCNIDKLDENDRICFHHKQRYLKKFGNTKLTGLDPAKCSNPFSILDHKGKVKGQTNIGVELSLRAKACNIMVKPGLKICLNCKKRLNRDLKAAEITVDKLSDSDDEAKQKYLQHKKVEDGNNALKSSGVPLSPLHMHGVSWERPKSVATGAKRILYQLEQKQSETKKHGAVI